MFFLCAVDGVSCGKKKMGITINNKQFKTDVATIMNTLLNISKLPPLNGPIKDSYHLKSFIGIEIRREFTRTILNHFDPRISMNMIVFLLKNMGISVNYIIP